MTKEQVSALERMLYDHAMLECDHKLALALLQYHVKAEPTEEQDKKVGVVVLPAILDDDLEDD